MNNKQTSTLYSNSLEIDNLLISKLDNMPFSEMGTRRICLHKDQHSPLHVMLVETKFGEIYKKHRHTDSDEITIIISGELDVRIWTEENNANFYTTYKLNQNNSKALFIKKDMWHQTIGAIPNTKYLEIKLGPFNPNAMQKYSEYI